MRIWLESGEQRALSSGAAQGPRDHGPERLLIQERWGPEGEELGGGPGGRFTGGEQDSDSGLEEKQQLMGQKDWPGQTCCGGRKPRPHYGDDRTGQGVGTRADLWWAESCVFGCGLESLASQHIEGQPQPRDSRSPEGRAGPDFITEASHSGRFCCLLLTVPWAGPTVQLLGQSRNLFPLGLCSSALLWSGGHPKAA